MGDFERVHTKRHAFEADLDALKATRPDIPWYPYGTLNNIDLLTPLITPELDELFSGGRRFADIGAADGDLSFYMESRGNSCDIVDFRPTNFNGLRGAEAMRDMRKSSVQIQEVDLDAQFQIDGTYDLIFFLGILYHLKNPYYALERLAKHARYAFLSTRIARRFKAGGPDVSAFSAAYLLGPDECNNDSTNYWIFSDAGLKQILNRCGWDVIAWRLYGSEDSNPQDNDRDQRAFCAIRSRSF